MKFSSKLFILSLSILLVPVSSHSMIRGADLRAQLRTAAPYVGGIAAAAFGLTLLTKSAWGHSKNWLHGKLYPDFEQQKEQIKAEHLAKFKQEAENKLTAVRNFGIQTIDKHVEDKKRLIEEVTTLEAKQDALIESRERNKEAVQAYQEQEKLLYAGIDDLLNSVEKLENKAKLQQSALHNINQALSIKEEESERFQALFTHSLGKNLALEEQKEQAVQKKKEDFQKIQTHFENFGKNLEAKFANPLREKLDQNNQRLDSLARNISQVQKNTQELAKEKAAVQEEKERKEKHIKELEEQAQAFAKANPMLNSIGFEDLFERVPQEIRAGYIKIIDVVNIDLNTLLERAARGDKIREYLRTSNREKIEQMTTTQEVHLNAIIDIVWSFYYEALKTSEGFEEGTFEIDDQDFKLRNFLQYYSKKVNPTLQFNGKDPLNKQGDNPFAYSRNTSHYKDAKKLHGAYGIEMRFNKDDESQPLLPANKRHILFGVTDDKKQKIYLKPENYGIYAWKDLWAHTGEFGAAQVRKQPAIRTPLEYVINVGTDDAEQNRKDRVVEKFVDDCQEALAKDNLSLEQKADLMKLITKDGFKALFSPQASQSPSLKPLIAKYEKQYSKLEDRIGREVKSKL